MRIHPLFIALLVIFIAGGCKGGNQEQDTTFPSNFNALPDTARVAYVMKNAAPDSVARFICRAALGQIKDARIDNLGIATNYAYEKYMAQDADTFGSEYDNFVSSLPLADKMRMYALAGLEDPQGLGLQLGLEYLQSIREKNMTVSDVDNEIKAFKKACGNDSTLYERFMVGFRTVLEVDSGRDVPKEIYNKYK